MANYNALITAITNVIRANGNNEITGPLLQQSLLSMVASLGAGFQYVGLATPATNPGAPDQRIFYFAASAGRYVNFNNIDIYDDELSVLVYDDGWRKESLFVTDLDVDTIVQISQLYINAMSQISNRVTDSAVAEEGPFCLLKDGSLFSLAPNSMFIVRTYAVSPGNAYVVQGRVRASADNCLYCFYDSEGNFISYGIQGTQAVTNYTIVAVAPDNAATIKVCGHRTTFPPSLSHFEKERDVWTFRPVLLTRGLSVTSGAYSVAYYGRRLMITKYIAADNDFLITASRACFLRILYYDTNFSYLGFWGSVLNYGFSWLENGVPKNVDTTIFPGAKYVRFEFANDSNYVTDLPDFSVSLTGDFQRAPEVFDPRPADDGYVRLVVAVNIANTIATDGTASEVQDEELLLPDYGVLALPEQYSNTGEPTRLIIYCHGAAVNYSDKVTRFDAGDLNPEYWLSEGYAVMDIEGNPFDNENEHFYIPQARQSYMAAYKFATEVFNIRRDGIFLGGRSMGGAMCFELLQSTLPIIAACPLAPVGMPLWCWEYMNAARRRFCADKLGFTGTAPAWTTGSPMSSEEWEYLKANFDKFVRYSPQWRGIQSLPDKEALFANPGNVSAAAPENEVEATFYESLHFTAKAPVKLFTAKDDNIVPYKRGAMYYYRMMLNAAHIVELRLFETGGHHYELQPQNIVPSWVNSYGVTLGDVPVTYIEMLQFWKRYEQ